LTLDLVALWVDGDDTTHAGTTDSDNANSCDCPLVLAIVLAILVMCNLYLTRE